MTKKSSPPPLFDVGRPKTKPGPVYQGVNKEIRALERAGTIDRLERAGTIAQARSLAASIDRVSGHDGTGQASGMQLAAMHEQLDGLLARLAPDTGDTDEFQEFLASLGEDDPAGDADTLEP